MACVAGLSLVAVLATQAAAAVATYPAPAGAPISDLYEVTVIQGQKRFPSPVYITTPPPETGVHDGAVFYRDAERSFSWTTFCFDGTVTVEVRKLDGPFQTVTLRPRRYGLKPEILDDGRTVRFELSRQAAKVSVEFDGRTKDAMLIFADPPEDPQAIPWPDAPNVYAPQPGEPFALPDEAEAVCFRPGLYELGYWRIPPSVRQVYLAGGSYVLGALGVRPRQDPLAITGRGVLSGERFPWHAQDDGEDIHMIQMRNCGGRGHLLEGITIVNSPYYSVSNWRVPLDIRHVKLLGNWRFNNDGVDAMENSTIEDCFFQADDDTIKLYASDATVRRCVIWQLHNGAVFQFGWFNKTASGGRISQIDVIHMESTWAGNDNLGLINFRPRGNKRDGVIRDFLFEDIVMEGPVLRALALRPPSRQAIRDITIRDLWIDRWRFTPPPDGQPINYLQGQGPIENIRIVNLRVGGQLVDACRATSEDWFRIGPNAKGIHFEADARPAPADP